MVELLEPQDPGSEVVLVAYDDAWPALYARQERRIRDALGDRALEVHHCGSTSVPGLSAKPVVDVVLVVAEPGDEATYVPDLVAAGFTLVAREPDWWDHRVLKDRSPRVNLHVFGPACDEVARMLAFRDHLRSHDRDRATYERTKRELARREWARVQDYADAKSDVVEDILRRVLP